MALFIAARTRKQAKQSRWKRSNSTMRKKVYRRQRFVKYLYSKNCNIRTLSGNHANRLIFYKHLLTFFSLQEVIMQENRLYLIFEFLSMDLKKYLDTIPEGVMMEPSLVKVSHAHIFTNVIIVCFLRIIYFKFVKVSASVISVALFIVIWNRKICSSMITAQ